MIKFMGIYYLKTNVTYEIQLGNWLWIRFVRPSFIPFGSKTGTGRLVIRKMELNPYNKTYHWKTIKIIGK